MTTKLDVMAAWYIAKQKTFIRGESSVELWRDQPNTFTGWVHDIDHATPFDLDKGQKRAQELHAEHRWLASGEEFIVIGREEAERRQIKNVPTGRKDDAGKLRWALLFPWRAAAEIMKVLELGSQKYAAGNWMLVPNGRQRYIEAIMRHAIDASQGQRFDPESKLRTLAHLGCDVLFAIWFELKEDGELSPDDEAVPSAKT